MTKTIDTAGADLTEMTEFADRIFIIDKRPGPTSFDVVEAFRRCTRIRKVGHTGTLDPLASGVLILCSGKATRAVEHFMNLGKTYEFEIRLGVGTTTLDAEGDVTEEVPCPEIAPGDVLAAASRFIGDCVLEPPVYSAIKHNGKRLYELARAGETPRVEGRRVRIYSFDIEKIELPGVFCRVECSRGTYIRSLARDFGSVFGLPAHIRNLVRTAVGRFRIEDGYSSDRVAAGDLSGLRGMKISEALDFLPAFVVTEAAQRGLMNGVLPGHGDVVETIGVPGEGGAIRLLGRTGELLAIGKRGEGAARDPLKCVDSYRLYTDNGRP